MERATDIAQSEEHRGCPGGHGFDPRYLCHDVAQWVEQRSSKPWVAGSSPAFTAAEKRHRLWMATNQGLGAGLQCRRWRRGPRAAKPEPELPLGRCRRGMKVHAGRSQANGARSRRPAPALRGPLVRARAAMRSAGAGTSPFAKRGRIHAGGPATRHPRKGIAKPVHRASARHGGFA